MASESLSAQETRNVETFHKVIDLGFSQGKLDSLDGPFTRDFQEHQDGMNPPDLEGTKGAISQVRISFPDLKLEIVDFITKGEMAWFRLKGHGTHMGQFGPMPATGKRIEIDVIDICRFQDGLIAEHWGIPDRFSVMRQIGLPQPPKWLFRLLTRRHKADLGTNGPYNSIHNVIDT